MTNLIALPGGTELVGDYRIERVLGAGGFGVTYLATELALDRLVTIKEYFPADFAARASQITAAPRSQGSEADYKWGLDRFIEEAQTLAKFDHPNIVRVYRYFRANNTGYMVLHFEEGHSLKSWLKGLGRAVRQKELDPIVAPLLDALELIHQADFLHRDIAPDNIIVRKDGSPVLIDFGSARGEIAAHSKTVSALVKPGYSPYEQYASNSAQQGPWTDIYALAATLYHAVTGKRPVDAPSRMVKDEVRPAREVALSSYRPRFLKAIDRALSLDVRARPQSVPAWRGDLLAPEPSLEPAPARPSIFERGRAKFGGIAGGSAKSAAGNARGGAKAQAADAATVTAPPPPDAPGPQGGMLDFLDGLKKKPEKPSSDPAPAARAKAPQGDKTEIVRPTPAAEKKGAAPAGTVKLEEPPRPPKIFQRKKKHDAHQAGKKPRARLGGGPAPKKAAAHATPKPNVKKKPDTKKVEKPAAAAPVARKKKTTAPKLPVVVARRAPRPRPTSRFSAKTVRPIVFKLLIGAGIATGAVGLQNGWWDWQRDVASKLGGPGNSTDVGKVSSGKESASRADATLARSKTPPSIAKPERETATRTAELTGTAPVTTQSIANPLIRQVAAHEGAVRALEISPDGRTIVTSGADAVLKIWDADTGALRHSAFIPEGPAVSIATQDQRALTGHERGVLILWDLQNATRLQTFKNNEANIWSVAFTSVKGRFAAAGHDWKVTLWDAKTPNTPVHVFEGHRNAVQVVAKSPDARYLASGSADKTVKLWNLETLDLVRTYRGARDFVSALAFSPDGKTIAAASLDGRIRLLSTSSGRTRRWLRGHRGTVNSLAFSPNGGVLASASADGTVRLWNVERGRTVRTLASPAGAVNAIAFAKGGTRLATAGDDGRLRFWSSETVRR